MVIKMKKYIKNRKKSKTEWLKKYIIITVAAWLYAVGVSLFIDPNHMAPGGITGISIILNRFLPVGTGTWIFLLNIPILLFAVWKFGLGLTVSSIYAIILISFFTNILSAFAPYDESDKTTSFYLHTKGLDHVYVYRNGEATDWYREGKDEKVELKDVDIIMMYNFNDRHFVYEPDIDFSDFEITEYNTMRVAIRKK